MYSAMASWEQDDSGAEASIARGNGHAHKNGERVVLVANNPRSYREAISTVLQELCADCEVTAVEPEALDLQVDRIAPEVVIFVRRPEREPGLGVKPVFEVSGIRFFPALLMHGL